MTDRVGQQLGNYHLIQQLGRGGFADVYLGKHHHLQSYAALKILWKSLNERDEQQFLVEAQTLVRLRHPHIVKVLDFTVEQGTPVLIIEYAPHGTLQQRYPSGSRLSLSTTVDFVLQIAAALQYAHNHYVIHRDVKPGNILLDADQRLMISDFGLALFAPSPELLSTQEMAGTLPYIAPEQLQGKAHFASDQYALGVMVYEWLCGKRPFEGNAWQLLQQHLEKSPQPLRNWCPELPADVEAVILRALAKDPRERFVSIQAFAQALARISQKHLLTDQNDTQITAPYQTVPHHSRITFTHFSSSSTPQPAEPRAQMRRSMPSPNSSNRQRLLAKVRAFWISGVLEHSLHGQALISLGLHQHAEAVAHPWRLVLQEAELASQRFPSDTNITQAYDDAGGDLLILGEPGSGKTTLLLGLARDLLDRAQQDETHPIPVVFNLSSWAASQQPLTAWLIEELTSKYQVSRKQARTWVESDQILPLLDGFDEVASSAHGACLESINSYREEHGLLPCVICSRTTEFLAQKTGVRLAMAVVVQPLTSQQVNDYLVHGGEPLWALRVALYQDGVLRELANSPLMLNILILTYYGMPIEDLLRGASLPARQSQVLECYITRMLERKGTNPHYTPQQTMHWLSWLARQLVQHHQSVFYIERMQPDWLSATASTRRYPRYIAGLTFGLVGMLGLGPAGGLILTNILQVIHGYQLSLVLILVLVLLFGLLSGSLFGTLNALFYTQETEAGGKSATRWSWRKIRRCLVQSVVNGFFVGLLLGCPYGLALALEQHLESAERWAWMLGTGIIIGLLGGLGFGLIDVLLALQTTYIQPAEIFLWSWAKMGRNLMKFLLFGFLGSLLTGLLLGLSFGLSSWLLNRTVTMFTVLSMISSSLHFTFTFGPFFVLLTGLIGGIMGGLSSDEIEDHNRSKPNQGIRRSVLHAILIGVGGGLVGGIIGGLLGGRVSNVQDPHILWTIILAYGVITGLLIGLMSGLRGGGMAGIQHLVLRWQFRQTGCMPWNYSCFLDYAAERILLRKVGGGYIFVHGLLLQYFARLDEVFASRPDSLD